MCTSAAHSLWRHATIQLTHSVILVCISTDHVETSLGGQGKDALGFIDRVRQYPSFPPVHGPTHQPTIVTMTTYFPDAIIHETRNAQAACCSQCPKLEASELDVHRVAMVWSPPVCCT